MRNWKPEDVFDVECPSCGADIEFWKDEPFRTCSACSMEVRNPKVDFGCAKWCKYAEWCVGEERATATVEASIRDRLVAAMTAAHEGDRTRVDYALNVLQNAEQLLAAEGGDGLVVKAAALLRDTGNRDPSFAAHAVLDRLGVGAETSARVCRLIESLRGATQMDTLEARIVRDAERLAKTFAGCEDAQPKHPLAMTVRAFETQKGRELAEGKLSS